MGLGLKFNSQSNPKYDKSEFIQINKLAGWNVGGEALKKRYRVHRVDVVMRRDQASFEQFLNNLDGEVVSVIPNVSPSYTWGGMGAKVRYLWVIEKMNL